MNESNHPFHDSSNFKDFLRGLLLVALQVFTLPYRIILSSIASLADWGRKGRLPSTESDFPVLTFVIVDLKPFVIILTVVFAVLAAIPTFGTSLIFGYLMLPVISYSFEIVALFISGVNSLKKIERK